MGAETTTYRALKALSVHVRLPASTLGAMLWPEGPPGGGRGVSVNGGGYYAAQMLLGRLRKRGFVHTCDTEGSSVWTLTTAGVHELRRLEGA